MKRQMIAVMLMSCFLLCIGTVAGADVSPGDVIDKTNWQKIEGLVPESMLNWVKNGDWVLNIADIDYDPTDYIRALEKPKVDANRGRYALRDGDVVDSKTGEMPDFIDGVPFPDIDYSHPQAIQMYMINREYIIASLGWIRSAWGLHWLNRDGLQRSTEYLYFEQPMDGNPDVKGMPNPDGVRKYSLYKFTDPYDISGTAQQTWRFRESKKRDLLFAYVPTIRRVRRLSPANRSDAVLGSDFANDDAFLFDGKVADFEFKLIKKTHALMPFTTTEIVELIPTDEGYLIDPNVKQHKYGFEVDGWQGAAWANTSVVWVMFPTLVIEAKAKDPYYNYGLQYFWIDAETGHSGFKVIHNRNGQYWKTVIVGSNAASSKDGKARSFGSGYYQAIDDRNQRSSITSSPFWGNKRTVIQLKDSLDKYSMAGFARFCK